MNALDTLLHICEHSSLLNRNLRYCLVDSAKHPIQPTGEAARPNRVEDFVELQYLLQCKDLSQYAGVGISIQASNICAIDIDHCFANEFDINSADDRAKDMIAMFKQVAYIEFSFSGHGMRILFKHAVIDNYAAKYYIKNDKAGIEYYQPNNSFRYVTITGQTIADNQISFIDDDVLYAMLNKYMLRPIIMRSDFDSIPDDRTVEDLMKTVKRLYFTDMAFQNLWFMSEQDHILILHCNIQGASRESHADYQLLSLLFEHVTQNKEKLRLIFEASPYFKSKDSKHLQKWLKSEYRYYEYQYRNIKALHSQNIK